MLALLAWMFVGGIVAILLHWIYFLKSQPANLPPGPLPLPLIGSCYMFALREPKEVFKELYAKYGGAVTLYSGCSSVGRMVLLLDWDIINETFNGRKYEDGVNDVPHNISKIRGVREGFGWSPYENYKERRTFTIRCFKELGLASYKLTPHTFDELDRMASAIEAKRGAAFNPNDILSESVSSCILLAGILR